MNRMKLTELRISNQKTTKILHNLSKRISLNLLLVQNGRHFRTPHIGTNWRALLPEALPVSGWKMWTGLILAASWLTRQETRM